MLADCPSEALLLLVAGFRLGFPPDSALDAAFGGGGGGGGDDCGGDDDDKEGGEGGEGKGEGEDREGAADASAAKFDAAAVAGVGLLQVSKQSTSIVPGGAGQ